MQVSMFATGKTPFRASVGTVAAAGREHAVLGLLYDHREGVDLHASDENLEKIHAAIGEYLSNKKAAHESGKSQKTSTAILPRVGVAGQDGGILS